MTKNLFTNITIKKSSSDKGPMAYGSAVIAGVVKINFILRQGKDGSTFASLPSHKSGDKWYNDVHFPDDEVYTLFQKAILDAYSQMK